MTERLMESTTAQYMHMITEIFGKENLKDQTDGSTMMSAKIIVSEEHNTYYIEPKKITPEHIAQIEKSFIIVERKPKSLLLRPKSAITSISGIKPRGSSEGKRV